MGGKGRYFMGEIGFFFSKSQGNLGEGGANPVRQCVRWGTSGTFFDPRQELLKSFAMQKGNIRVQTENIFPIIKKFLYSDHDIFIRELVSNAVDATQKLKTLSSLGEVKGEIGDLSIEIQLDKEK